MLTFWVVASDHENIRAAVRFTTLLSAQREAHRLAELHHGRFFVLECVGAAKPILQPTTHWQESIVVDDDSF